MLKRKNKKIIKVNGMHCDHCASKITNALLANNIDKVKVNLKKKEVTIYSKEEIDLELIKTTISNIGFEYNGEV